MIEKLIEQLYASDPSGIRDMLEALSDFACDNRVLEAAATMLNAEDRGVREAASRLLILCSNEKAASLAAIHILSHNIAVRNLAGDILVKMGAVATKVTLPYVDSPNKDVRKFAIDILAQLSSTPEIIAKIKSHLSDPDQNVVCACIDALGALHSEKSILEVIQLFNKLEFAKPNIVNAAAKFPDKVSTQFFLGALSDQDPVVQLAAAEALAIRKDKEVVNALIKKLDSLSDLAKPVVLHSVVSFLDPATFDGEVPRALKHHLIEMMNDSEPVYVRAAIRGLRNFIDEDVIKTLVGCLGRSESIDDAIFSVLKEHAEKSIGIILESAKNGKDRTSKVKMIIGLIQNLLQTYNLSLSAKVMDEIADFISTNFSDLDMDTKIAALSTCEGQNPHRSVKVVKAGLEDAESAVKSYALDLAARIGPLFFDKELEKLKEDYDEEIRDAAVKLLARFKAGTQKQQ
ncbi:MAG TPA: HEAT repeat domain-containing protein [Candidatus Acidoferrales bacterium]|nr:HEAT repeat domain-containing protein [Candidatus Acidoferrales bacterium]